MKVTIDNKNSFWAKEYVLKAVPLAEAFIKRKYPHIDFSELPVNFNGNKMGSHYKTVSKRIEIGIRTGVRHFYARKRVGLTTPPEGIFVKYTLAAILSIVHETTHHVQGEGGGRRFSEVETTRNEIEYLKEFAPEFYNELIEV